jgi:hypothetical protein
MFRSTALLPRVAAALAAATLLAACGSGSTPSKSASGAGTVSLNGVRMSSAAANRALLRFASCMHSHGVNGLPSPVSSPAAFKQSFSTTTPVYTQAMGQCQRLIAGQQNGSNGGTHSRKQIDGMLAFARCIRSHGLSRFPDPTSTGDLTHTMLAQAGIDLHQPAVAQAADACVSVTHGVVTRAMVVRFIAGQ